MFRTLRGGGVMQTIKKIIKECNIYYLINCIKSCGIEMLTEDELYLYKQTCENCYYQIEEE